MFLPQDRTGSPQRSLANSPTQTSSSRWSKRKRGIAPYFFGLQSNKGTGCALPNLKGLDEVLFGNAWYHIVTIGWNKDITKVIVSYFGNGDTNSHQYSCEVLPENIGHRLRESPKRSDGCENGNNVCYVNASLMLLGCTVLAEKISSLPNDDEEDLLLAAVKAFLVNNGRRRAIAIANKAVQPELLARAVTDAVRNNVEPTFEDPAIQQDAHEFLSALLDKIKGSLGGLLINSRTTSQTCSECSHQWKHEPVVASSTTVVNLPKSRGALDLQDLIDAGQEGELVEVTCQKCSHHQAKQVIHYKFSQIIGLQLPRFIDKNQKNQLKVVVPEYLTVHSYCGEEAECVGTPRGDKPSTSSGTLSGCNGNVTDTESKEKVAEMSMYMFMGAVIHHGESIGEGHYTAILHDGSGSDSGTMPERWIEANDVNTKVMPKNIALYKARDACLLMYQRNISDVPRSSFGADSATAVTSNLGVGACLPLSDLSSDSEFEVEEISDRKEEGNVVTYLVKWSGSEEQTWEPESNLKNAMDLVKHFNEDIAARKAEAGRSVLEPESTRAEKVVALANANKKLLAAEEAIRIEAIAQPEATYLDLPRITCRSAQRADPPWYATPAESAAPADPATPAALAPVAAVNDKSRAKLPKEDSSKDGSKKGEETSSEIDTSSASAPVAALDAAANHAAIVHPLGYKHCRYCNKTHGTYQMHRHSCKMRTGRNRTSKVKTRTKQRQNPRQVRPAKIACIPPPHWSASLHYINYCSTKVRLEILW